MQSTASSCILQGCSRRPQAWLSTLGGDVDKYLVPFGPYQWDRGDSVKTLRFISANRLGRYAFYDLDRKCRLSEEALLWFDESEVLADLGSALRQVEDRMRDSLPKEGELSDKRREERAARWKLVARIFARDVPVDDPGTQPIFTDEIYFSMPLFRTQVLALARAHGCKVATQHYKYFWACIRYGGDEYALTDRKNLCGGPGKPRSTLIESKKPGRKEAAYFRDPTSYDPQDRVDPFWRRRALSAIIFTLACTPQDAPTLLASPSAFRDLMYAGFCCAGNNMRMVARRKMPAKETPKPQSMERLGRKMINQLSAEIAPMLSDAVPRSPGASTDIAHGKQLIADMDVTDFRKIRIMYVTKDESEMRELGAPRVVLMVVRGSDFIVGYYITIGFERTDVYLNGLLSGLVSKGPRLKALGFDAQMKGLESGNVDLVLTDGGAGKSRKAKVFVLKDLNADHAKTAPYHPQGKGNGEGTNYRLKRRVSSNLPLAEELLDGVAQRIERMGVDNRLQLQHGQGLPTRFHKDEDGGVVFAREFVFEQVLVEAIAEHNLARLTQKRALTEKIFAKATVPTRRDLFIEQQESRRGDRNYMRTEEEICAAILRSKEKFATLLHGLVTLPDGEYGGRAHQDRPNVRELMKWERAERLARGLPDDKGIRIRVSSPPYGNFVTWHSDDGRFLDIPATPAHLHLVGLNADRARVVAMHLAYLSDQNRDVENEMDGKRRTPKNFSRKAVEQSRAIKQKRGIRPTTSSRPRSKTIDLHREDESQKSYESAVGALGVKPAPVPGGRAASDSSSLANLGDDLYGLAELQSAVKGRKAKRSK